MDGTLRELLRHVSELGYEDDYGPVFITSATRLEADLSLDLSVEPAGNGASRWRVRCGDVRECQLTFEAEPSDICVEDDRPLIMPHVARRLDLYFSGDAVDPDRTVGKLLHAHRAVVGEWIDCWRYFNDYCGRSLADLLQGGFGLLANGPEPLVAAYADVMHREGFKTSSTKPRPPVSLKDGRWVTDDRPLTALLLGRTFVIAPTITAIRV